MIGNRWLHTPYKYMGRTEEGCDCWGFVRLVLKEEKGVVLPSFDGVNEVDGMKYAESFRPLQGPEDWCLVKMVERRNHLHAGLYLEGFVIHMTHNGVVMQRIKQIKGIIRGYYSYACKNC